MFASLFRIFSYVILAGGLLIAIVDAIRSVALGSMQMTSLGKTLETYVPSMAAWLATVEKSLADTQISSWPLSNVIIYITSIPVALLAAGLFLLIYEVASRKRTPRHF